MHINSDTTHSCSCRVVPFRTTVLYRTLSIKCFALMTAFSADAKRRKFCLLSFPVRCIDRLHQKQLPKALAWKGSSSMPPSSLNILLNGGMKLSKLDKKQQDITSLQQSPNIIYITKLVSPSFAILSPKPKELYISSYLLYKVRLLPSIEPFQTNVVMDIWYQSSTVVDFIYHSRSTYLESSP